MVRKLSIRVAIIGAGPAGMAAALYLKRSGLDPILLEKSAPGGQVVTTYKVENYLGFNEINGADLSLKMFEQLQKQEVEYKTFDVKTIKRKANGFTLVSPSETLECDKIIIATGKRRRHLNLDKEDKLKGVSYCAICDGMFYKGKDVAIVGGADSAVTEAIYLSNICHKVYLIVRNEIRAKETLTDRMTSLENIEIIKGKQITKLIGEEYLEKVVLNDRKILDISGLFVSIGGIPNNDFLNEVNVDLKAGYIVTNEKMETSEKGIYAVGDIREKAYYQIATAINDGVVAALTIAENKE